MDAECLKELSNTSKMLLKTCMCFLYALIKLNMCNNV